MPKKEVHICSFRFEDQKGLQGISWRDLEQQSLRMSSVSLQPVSRLVMQWQILTSLPNLQTPFPVFTLLQYPNLICI